MMSAGNNFFDTIVGEAAEHKTVSASNDYGSFGTRQRSETSMVQINIPCLISYVTVARQSVSALGEVLLFSPEDISAIKLAVGEACNNAILYSTPVSDGSFSQIVVACHVTPEALEIDVTNHGEAFQPGPMAKMPDADVFSEHGRGMALMGMMMDNVEYVRNDGMTTVRLRKNRRPAAEQPI
jgi:serine/threonine-protein kinase RsbW